MYFTLSCVSRERRRGKNTIFALDSSPTSETLEKRERARPSLSLRPLTRGQGNEIHLIQVVKSLEQAQWIKHFLYKHENLVEVSRIYIKARHDGKLL